MSNVNLEQESTSYFYIIEADRDGVRKYVSRAFPKLWQYTPKISKARHFQTEEQANHFIKSFNDYGKYLITNPIVKRVCRVFIVEEE
jgi:hypothetical protein